MKRSLLIIFSLLFLASYTYSQVICDFEVDAQGFIDYGWGSGLESVQQGTDGAGNGVLQVAFNGTKGAEGIFGAPSGFSGKTTAKILTYYLWLPTGTPDNLHIQLFAQDNAHWSHKTSDTYWAKDIPKEVWFPVSFNLEQTSIKNPADFDIINNNYGWLGIGIGTWDSDPGVLAWTGNILVDNISYIGVQPVSLADFEIDAQGFSNYGWGSGIVDVQRTTDGAGNGVLQVAFNGTQGTGGAFGAPSGFPGKTTANILTYYLWLPTGIPDSLHIQLFVQDNAHWSHKTSDTYWAKDIPKEVWYPVYLNLEQLAIKNPADFDIINNNFGWLGIDVGTWNSDPGVLAWTGNILVNEVELLSSEVGSKWVMSDFNTPAKGVDDFTLPGFNAGITALSRVDVDNNGVLQAATDLSKGTNPAIQKEGIKLGFQTEDGKDTVISGVSIDLFLPSDFPANSQVHIIIQPKGGDWPWLNKIYDINESAVAPGKWNTLQWDLADFRDRVQDLTLDNIVFVEFKNLSGSWAGNLYFDNMTILGRPAPELETVTSPATIVAVDTVEVPSGTYQVAHLEWIDNPTKTMTETYNIYRSESPITDLNAEGVVLMADKVPHGLQTWVHRPWTKESTEKTYYYAITAVEGGVETELIDQCKVGPVAMVTSTTAKAKYDKDFGSSFVADGDGSEFDKYAAYSITPETGFFSSGDPFTLDNIDANWKINFVIDDVYLYVYVDFIDDDLNDKDDQQAWSGDAIEFFMGAYDAKSLKALHPKGVQRTLGDWRISFNALGRVVLDGGAADVHIPGLETDKYVVLTKFGLDGFIVEARFTLDSLAEAGKPIKVVDGMAFPLKIDGTDQDPKLGDTDRSAMAQWGVTGGTVDQDWMRPSCWGYLEVVDGPTVDVAKEDLLPKDFRLYNNYPNPFNPTTTIKYDLPKESNVTLKIFDITGREVATLVDEVQGAGYKQINFNASNLSSGIYFYKLSAGNFIKTEKMMLLK